MEAIIPAKDPPTSGELDLLRREVVFKLLRGWPSRESSRDVLRVFPLVVDELLAYRDGGMEEGPEVRASDGMSYRVSTEAALSVLEHLDPDPFYEDEIAEAICYLKDALGDISGGDK
jgi:hypothetical protein